MLNNPTRYAAQVILLGMHASSAFDSVSNSVFDSAPADARVKREVFTTMETRKCLEEAIAYAISAYSNKSVVNESDGKRIDFFKKDIKHGLSGNAGLIDAFVATDLMTLAKKAKYVRSMPPKSGQPGVIAVHVYAGRFDIGGHVLRIGIIVKERNDGNRYYDHFEIKNKNPQ